MRLRSPLLLAGLAASCVSLSALAQSKGDWTVAVGAHQSLPSPTTAAWSAARSRRNISSPTTGIDVLAALPFQHDIAIRDLGRVGSTKHLPPVISLEYHFNAQGKLSRFVGAGIHYTCFFCAPTPTARWPAAI